MLPRYHIYISFLHSTNLPSTIQLPQPAQGAVFPGVFWALRSTNAQQGYGLAHFSLSPPLSYKSVETTLLGRGRDRKRIDTIVSEREEREEVESYPNLSSQDLIKTLSFLLAALLYKQARITGIPRPGPKPKVKTERLQSVTDIPAALSLSLLQESRNYAAW